MGQAAAALSSFGRPRDPRNWCWHQPCRRRGRAASDPREEERRHRGHKKAMVAVAHVIVRAAYQVLAPRAPISDPGPDYVDRSDDTASTASAQGSPVL